MRSWTPRCGRAAKASALACRFDFAFGDSSRLPRRHTRQTPVILLALAILGAAYLTPVAAQDAGSTDSGSTDAGSTDAGQPASNGDASEGSSRSVERVTPSESMGPSDSRGDVYKPLGPNLFPFYTHELRTSDNTEIINILGLYSSTKNLDDGSSSRLLLPFFFTKNQISPRDSRLYLFPLYYQFDSDELQFRYLVPFYFDHRTTDSEMQLLVPFWMRKVKDDGLVTENHVLFPLLRVKNDRRIEDRTVLSVRFGLWRFLEFYEHRSTKDTSDTTAFNLFNWSDEAQSGLPLYSSNWIREDWGDRGSRYLFPLFFHGKGRNSNYLWVLPFFGYSADGAEQDYSLVPLLSRYGRGPGDALRLDLLFPLFHYARGKNLTSIASFLLFDYYDTPEKQHLGILLWLYRSYHDNVRGTTTRMILYPLSNFTSSDDGKTGFNWFFPYFDTWDEKQRFRFAVPFFFKKERIVGGESDSYFTWAIPTYFSWGHPEDNFSMGIPFYWASHNSGKGWRFFAPFYYDFYSRISRSLHVIPLYSYVRAPHSEQRWFLGPLFVHKRFYDLNEQRSGTGYHFLWPFIKIENHRDGYDYKFFPFFHLIRRENTQGTIITPLYGRVKSPEGTSHYFLPVYYKFQSPRERLDTYATGAYSRHQTFREDGTIARDTSHYAWWMATFEENIRGSISHQRILPLMYWRTASPAVTRTVAGPFYYSHRIHEEEKVHELGLVLGNLFYSKTVLGPPSADEAETFRPLDLIPSEVPRIDPKSAATEVDSDGTDGTDGSDETEGTATPNEPPKDALVVHSTDRGILWPLTRTYRDNEGNKTDWVLPFYANIESGLKKTTSFFPFYFGQESESTYEASYFRYFFLTNWESFQGGGRWSFGQLIFDLLQEEQENRLRVRFLYPLFQFETSDNRTSYMVTPLISGETKVGGGERSSKHQFFPILFRGKTERIDSEGNWAPEKDHFLLFPLYGYERKSTRIDYLLFYPIFHLQRSPESLNFELWPLLFYRRSPALSAFRLWPFHAQESGETAGEFWVSKYLFLSKLFRKEAGSKYRLDPFLFRYEKGKDTFGIAGLFEALSYDRGPEGSSFRAIPFVFGHSNSESAATAFIPFHFSENFGEKPIDYWSMPRFFFLSSLSRGAKGAKYFSLLTWLFEYGNSSQRPNYSELRFLYRIFFRYKSETAHQVELNPLFQYYRDDVEGVRSFSILFSLYRQETHRHGGTKRTLFFFIPL